MRNIKLRNFFIFFYKFKIFKRLIPSIIRKIYFNNIQFIEINNFKISLNVKSSIDREIYLKGIYDEEKFNFFEKYINLKKFDYFIDVGSYIGYYSLYLGSKYKNLKVLTFEPIKESFNQIEMSKEINKLNNLEIFNYALSDNENNNEFWVTDLKKKSGFSLLNNEDFNHEVNKYKYDRKKISFIKVKTEIFDKKFTIENKLIFVKIDVERHEYNTLLGSVNFLTKSNNKIFIQIEIVDHLKEKVLSLLKIYNFKVIKKIAPSDKRGGHDYYLTNYNI
tara:strand:+ start:292 stop:1122 length:831 start_codon:yes stop_codon:yes gene_type:complete